MSLELRKTSKGESRWVVRWREGGKYRARSFTRRGDARAWESEVDRRRRLGQVGMLDRGRTTLDELRAEWWEHQRHDLSPKSRQIAEGAWRVHLRDQLGGRQIGKLDPREIERWARARLDDGAGEAALEKAWQQLGQVLGRAESWGWIPRNPVRLAKRPRKHGTRRRARVLSPLEIERVRGAMNARDAALVSVLAYAGLRPGEALALLWDDVGERISVTKAVSMGEIRKTKTGRDRSVPAIAPLASDLRAWRLMCPPGGLVFPAYDGEPWRDHDTRAWAGRSLKPALREAGIDPKSVRTYDLRHTAASLLIASGLNVIEVARRMGHQPSLCLDTYSHIFDEWEGRGPIDLEAEIRRAREAA